MSVLSSPHFHDEAKAYEYLEGIVWAGGVVCPHCGVTDVSPLAICSTDCVVHPIRSIFCCTIGALKMMPLSAMCASLSL